MHKVGQDASRISTRHGFSLVELFVVIGVGLILIGLMLPTLSNLRLKAIRIECQSQVRQMAISVSGYAATENDHVPFMFNLTRNQSGAPYATTPSGLVVPADIALAAGDFWIYPMIDEYGGSFVSEGLLCPLDDQTASAADWVASHFPTFHQDPWIPLARPISRAFYTRPASLQMDRDSPLALQDARVAAIFEVIFPSAKAMVFEEVPFHPNSTGSTRSSRVDLSGARLTVASTDGSVNVRAILDAKPPVLIGVATPFGQIDPAAQGDALQRAMATFHLTKDGVLGRDW